MLKKQIHLQNTKPQNFRIIFFVKPNWGPVLSADKVDYKVNYNGKLGMVLLSLLRRPEKSSWQLPAPGGTGVLLLVKTCMSYKRKELLFFFSGLPLLIKWKSPISFLLHSDWSPRVVSQVDPGGFKTATQSCMLKTAEKALVVFNL